MDKQTLSNYGWVVIVTLILATMLAFATPFGTYVGDAVVNVANGFFALSNSATDDDNIKNLENNWSEKLNGCQHKDIEIKNKVEATCSTDGYSGDLICKKCGFTKNGETVIASGHTMVDEYLNVDYIAYHKCTKCNIMIIPEGAVYYQNVISNKTGEYTDGIAIDAGKEFPTNVEDGDVYVYQGYEYRYNQCYKGTNGWWSNDDNQNGWGVRVLDANATTYKDVLESIGDKKITTMYDTYRLCSKMTSVPKIPQYVTNLSYTFNGCSKMPYAPEIPDGVTILRGTFSSCKEITTSPIIPENVIDMSGTFSSCSSLTTAPILPPNVTDISNLFLNCHKLNTYIGSKDGAKDFSNYIIPETVTDMGCTFDQALIEKAPVIPKNVKDLYRTFRRCYYMTGPIIVHANPDRYDDFLISTQVTEILGDTTMKAQLLATRG